MAMQPAGSERFGRGFGERHGAGQGQQKSCYNS